MMAKSFLKFYIMAWNKQLHHSQILKELKNPIPLICHILMVIRCIDEIDPIAHMSNLDQTWGGAEKVVVHMHWLTWLLWRPWLYGKHLLDF